ncbi:ABC transporter G family member 23 [Oryza glaberrima]|uniref:ABC transporter domain-containing protein n=1 Tax=Oryza glaberrima TaxID=4538 RepID=I1PV67_ORYGL|nr:ABC transporter G family member 23 [Oryza glaberrima]
MEDLSLSSELDPALLSTSTSSSSPPDSASPSFSFYHPSPPNYTLAVSNLSCRDPRRGSGGAGLLSSLLGSFSTSSPPATGGAGLLNNVSFTASSSQILAVVGPSGAGKSTLLRILSGRGTGGEIAARPHAVVSVNGRAVTSRARLRRMCGFVTQDDNLLPLLTVRETILFAARFRLRSAVTARERGERVEALLQELRLSEVADSYVGGCGGAGGAPRGVSGGERKRVSIAVDIVHDPPVLLLDEPTSGLDSRSAMDVLSLLRDVARARRQVVVLSIHQPSYRMLAYISSLLLLSRGAVAHFGTLKSLEHSLSRLGHEIPMQLNPLELAMEVTEQLEADHARFGAALATTIHQHQHNKVIDDEDESSGAGEHEHEHGYYCSRAVEVGALAVRCWRTMHRTRELFAARAAQAVIAGLGLGSVYFRIRPDPEGVALRLGLFAFSLSFLLSSTVEALPILLHERRVLMREASRRAYRLSSYVVANALVFAPCLLAVSLLFSAPVYFLAGLRATPLAFACFALAVWLIVLMASSLVLFLSAVSPDFVLGNSLICMSLGVFFLFSGYFIPRESIPRYWAFMYYVSMYRYPLDLLLINEYGGSSSGRCVAWAGGVCLRTGGDVLRGRGIDEGMRWVNVGVMLGFFVLYRVMCWAVLVRRAAKTTL